eukprot:3486443-Pyramimonas_sp.AAC.1
MWAYCIIGARCACWSGTIAARDGWGHSMTMMMRSTTSFVQCAMLRELGRVCPRAVPPLKGAGRSNACMCTGDSELMHRLRVARGHPVGDRANVCHYLGVN